MRACTKASDLAELEARRRRLQHCRTVAQGDLAASDPSGVHLRHVVDEGARQTQFRNNQLSKKHGYLNWDQVTVDRIEGNDYYVVAVVGRCPLPDPRS